MNEPRWTVILDGSAPPPRERIGGKAWSIARMRSLDLPVPPAFVVTTEACAAYQAEGDLPPGLTDELAAGVAWLEECTDRTFGSGPSPLLISVRSGAAISMPGMMDTILNLGINETTMAALATEAGDERFARDTYRRFHELYAGIVLKLPDPDLDPDSEPAAWRASIEQSAPQGVPQDVREQLAAAVRAVFDSWQSRRAKRYRKHHDIPDDLGTAVTVQAMVFGNLDDTSGTGVLFTRDPLTGERKPYGEYLARAQGEDVVSGRFTPQRIEELATALPAIHDQLMQAGDTLEAENGDIQDIEFTVQHGTLYLLQSRTAKRAPAAAVRAAVEMAVEGRINRQQVLERVTASQARSLLKPHLAEGVADRAETLATGQGASPGVGVGIVVTDSDEAERRHAAGEAVVLARATTSPDDVHGMLSATAVVTEQGGSTSHAAVVGRSLGLPCVVGCGDASVTTLAGRTVTVDGAAGAIYAGALDVVIPDERADKRLAQLLTWAAEASPLAVYRPEDAPADTNILDLDRIEGGEDPERLAELLAGHTAARGGAIASDEGVAAALIAGLTFIVADPTLPPLLAAIAAGNGPNESRPTPESQSQGRR
ncbi:pyruvate, phosphate dikinase [Salinisphaera sp. P385]|uniref:Pyruvate, phosphate dikinase n=1 Tax=Spectribacter acetivorans TaxID=3075603 RepID=A0ABU3B892_9GAMM|nr:pyruvate, phosphate dikinase [Salinisphaera sp. P385]MDT0618697.1 pyruvate, phosphate dikinase [Salinisphaera sp. P385]